MSLHKSFLELALGELVKSRQREQAPELEVMHRR